MRTTVLTLLICLAGVAPSFAFHEGALKELLFRIHALGDAKAVDCQRLLSERGLLAVDAPGGSGFTRSDYKDLLFRVDSLGDEEVAEAFAYLKEKKVFELSEPLPLSETQKGIVTRALRLADACNARLDEIGPMVADWNGAGLNILKKERLRSQIKMTIEAAGRDAESAMAEVRLLSGDHPEIRIARIVVENAWFRHRERVQWWNDEWVTKPGEW